ncbi:hypothetical protein K402DRAFT_388607 [Aulographum hederae CBS 113979]|uniref:N-acetyltransferase domain-containing protein n=1 Tax=Aulographum hederae CBS 113979 TaxID=1176131 RepID=A0A6G1HFS7_9PEZI|nr:hypothetical protein K402DRAFT_388607 [Aulographum hederae CBS 113979]
MDIQYSPATVGYARDMCDCGRRAFENDLLDHALFPRHLQDVTNEEAIYKFRLERIRKRLENPRWRYLLATTDSGDGRPKVVGYSGWLAPLKGSEQDVNLARNQDEPEAKPEDTEDFPPGLDVDVYKHVMKIIEDTKKEILGKDENNVWNLASLAVDPDFNGRRIASNLVKWGLDQADEDQLPAYLESTPAAVGVYKRSGFKALKKLKVIKDNETHLLTVMIRKPN